MKKLKTLLVLLLTVLIAFPVVTTEAATIKLSKKTASVYVGKTVTLKLKNAKGTVKWSTSDKKIATVTQAGKVKGVKAGKATITATFKNKKYSCTVTVKNPGLNYTDAEMNPGEKATLKVQGTTVSKWSTSNKKVATVKKGVVTAVGEGTATIKAKCKNGKTYKCIIKVTVPKEIYPQVSMDFGELYLIDSVRRSNMEFELSKQIDEPYAGRIGRTDDSNGKITGIAIINDEKNYPTDNGTYQWTKITYEASLCDLTTNEKGQYVLSNEEWKKAKILLPNFALRNKYDALNENYLENATTDKNGYKSFTVEFDGFIYDDCKFKCVEIDRSYSDSWRTHHQTVEVYTKLPVKFNHIYLACDKFFDETVEYTRMQDNRYVTFAVGYSAVSLSTSAVKQYIDYFEEQKNNDIYSGYDFDYDPTKDFMSEDELTEDELEKLGLL